MGRPAVRARLLAGACVSGLIGLILSRWRGSPWPVPANDLGCGAQAWVVDGAGGPTGDAQPGCLAQGLVTSDTAARAGRTEGTLATADPRPVRSLRTV